MRFPPQFEIKAAPKPGVVNRKLTKPQFDALHKYAEENGHYWKQKLRDDWMNGRCEAELQQVRNNLGPRWLKDFKFVSYVGMDWPDAV